MTEETKPETMQAAEGSPENPKQQEPEDELAGGGRGEDPRAALEEEKKAKPKPSRVDIQNMLIEEILGISTQYAMDGGLTFCDVLGVLSTVEAIIREQFIEQSKAKAKPEPSPIVGP